MIDKHESITAKICSFVRAYHSAYAKERIFDDYLAYDLMGQDEYLKVGQLLSSGFDTELLEHNKGFKRNDIEDLVINGLSPIPLSRIAYTETVLKDFVKKNGKTQYVILGAGLDTFSFRNPDPNIEVYELDHPDTGRYKALKIKELELVIPKNVHFVPIDFNVDSLDLVLDKSGFNTDLPTVFSILGVTYYLNLEIFESTLKILDEKTNSRALVIFDYPDETTLTDRNESSRVFRLARMTELLGEKMTYGYESSELANALERHGFEVAEHLTPSDINERYFINRKDGMSAYENVHFMTGRK